MKNIHVVDLDEIRSILRQNRAEIQNRFQTEILGIFGSYSRGEEKNQVILISLSDLIQEHLCLDGQV